MKIKDRLYTNHCGGTLVASRWILTSGRCMVLPSTANLPDPKDIVGHIKLFDARTERTKRNQFTVEKVILHPEYQSLDGGNRVSNDVTLLRLDKPIESLNLGVEPIKLIDPEDFKDMQEVANREDSDHYITLAFLGWGGTRSSDRLMELKMARFLLKSEAKCGIYNKNPDDNRFCVGNPTGKDLCPSEGDSGGPLLIPTRDFSRYEQAGIVSGSLGCLKSANGLYTYHTDLSKPKVRDFIDMHISQ